MLNINDYYVKHKKDIWNNNFLFKIYLKILHFQKRIYKVSKKCHVHQTHYLQKSLISTYSIKVLAIEETLNNIERYYSVYKRKKYKFSYIQKSFLLKKLLNNNLFCMKKMQNRSLTFLLTEKIKQYILYLVLKPEWLPKFEYILKTNNWKYTFDITKRINIYFNNFVSHISKTAFIIVKTHKNCLKYLDTKYLINKLNTVSMIQQQILYWLDISFFMDDCSVYTYWYDYLWELLKRILNTGIEWNSYSKSNISYYFNYNILFYNVKSYFCYFNSYKNVNNYDLNNCFLHAIKSTSNNKAWLKTQSIFNLMKFTDTYVKKENIYYKYQITTKPSLRSIKELLYNFRKSLYHKNHNNYWRHNNYLSLVETHKAARRILSKWYLYYKNILYIDLIKHIDREINKIIYRWQLKQ